MFLIRYNLIFLIFQLLVLIPISFAGPPSNAAQSSGTHCDTDADCQSGLFGYSCLPPGGSASSSSQHKCQVVPASPTECNAIVCEGDAMYLTCPTGKTLQIVSAIYGRSESGDNVCPHNSIQTTSCSSTSSSAIVQSNCNGLQRCFIEAKNGLYGDPCQGTYKYIEVTYICQ